MPLDFPSSPSNGQTYTGPGGIVWQWEGAKWINGVSTMGGGAATGPAGGDLSGTYPNPTVAKVGGVAGPFLALSGGSLSGSLIMAGTGEIFSPAGTDLTVYTNTASGAGDSGWLTAVSGNATSGTTGSATFKSGNATTGTTGALVIRSGNATSNGTTGSIDVGTGKATGTGTSGSLFLYSAQATLGTSGNVTVTTGASSGAGNASGNITLTTGAATSGATRGTITLDGIAIFTGDARAVTPAAGDADTSIATTAFVAATVPNANLADNAGFAVNQRGYVSGTALAAGAFGHDRWKGGAGGGTYTFAAPAGPSNTITVTVGTLQQVIEGPAIAGGNYVLSWTGTAQGRVGAGSYAASPVSVAGITAGANTTIEFNAGTLSRVKFEGGTVATPWQTPGPVTDLQRCQRFYQTVYASSRFSATGTGQTVANSVGFQAMRGTPVAAVVTAGTNAIVTAISLAPYGANGASFTIQSTAAGDCYSLGGLYSLTADL